MLNITEVSVNFLFAFFSLKGIVLQRFIFWLSKVYGNTRLQVIVVCEHMVQKVKEGRTDAHDEGSHGRKSIVTKELLNK